MRKLLAAAAVAALAGALAAPALAGTRTVRVGDDYFGKAGTKPTLKVAKNTVVKWRWVGRRAHNVRVDRGPVRFASTYRTSGTFQQRLKRAGTYRIVCDLHPETMRMTIKVR
jgi:plastocyanin